MQSTFSIKLKSLNNVVDLVSHCNHFSFSTFVVFSFFTEFVAVHNGIITNYKDIKKFLVRASLN